MVTFIHPIHSPVRQPENDKKERPAGGCRQAAKSEGFIEPDEDHRARISKIGYL